MPAGEFNRFTQLDVLMGIRRNLLARFLAASLPLPLPARFLSTLDFGLWTLDFGLAAAPRPSPTMQRCNDQPINSTNLINPVNPANIILRTFMGWTVNVQPLFLN